MIDIDLLFGGNFTVTPTRGLKPLEVMCNDDPCIKLIDENDSGEDDVIIEASNPEDYYKQPFQIEG